MNKKNIFIVFVFLIIVLIGVGYFFVFKKSPQREISNTDILQNLPTDISKITDDQIVNFLRTNKDSLDYIEKYKDFRIEKKVILTKESILEGQSGENFKEVYQDLVLEDNRYLRVDLINSAGNWGLIAVLDFKNKGVVKAFGLMLINAGVQAK